jgi:3-keto-5-aminohexanoate cleavage enzyme
MPAIAASHTLITVAPTGAESSKDDVSALPVTLDELVATAKDCEAAGAGMIHIHIRDAQAAPTLDLGRLRDTVAAVREHTSLVVQLSTGGSVHDGYDARLRVLDAEPDSCSLTCGTVNFGDDVFMNPWPFMAELYQETQRRKVVPEFELFDLGHVHSMNRLLDRFGAPYGGQVHCDLVMGVPGGMPGTVQSLVAAVAALPAGATWSATGVGRSTLAVMFAALSAGGQLRVGMEDVLTYSRGVPVRDNAQLVARAADAATLFQRPPMSTDDARAMLRIRPLGDQAGAADPAGSGGAA